MPVDLKILVILGVTVVAPVLVHWWVRWRSRR